MKFGIKLWSINHDLYEEAVKIIRERKADYLELLYVPGEKEKLKILKKNKTPIIIHAPTLSQGVCFSDNNFKKKNKIMKETLNVAEYLNASKIIIHPSIGTSENFIRFLKDYQDKRFVIENMPKLGIKNTQCIGDSPTEIRKFLSQGPFGFCLDFSHAIKAAISHKIDYKDYLKEFMQLNPVMFHLSDGRLSTEIDEHLNLGKGNFDLRFIKGLIKENEQIFKKSKEVTFEVPKENGLKNDIKNIEFFKAIK